MKIPLSIRPSFIGDLLERAAQQERHSPAWHVLHKAVKQCRTFNDPDTTRQHQVEVLWPLMEASQKHLARLGVVVG